MSLPLKRTCRNHRPGKRAALVLSASTLLLETVLFRFRTTVHHELLRAALAAARSSNVGRKAMGKVDRRSALGIGLAAVSAAMVKPAAAQATSYKDTTPWPGVVVREYEGETPSLIPGFKTVSMRGYHYAAGVEDHGAPDDECHGLPYHRKGSFGLSRRERPFRARRILSGPATRKLRNRRTTTGMWSRLCGSPT